MVPALLAPSGQWGLFEDYGMADPETTPSLDEFESRLREARKREEEDSGREAERKGGPTSMGLGFRIGIELVVGLVLGTGLGWVLDLWLRTGPWLMLLFLFLGGAAGVMNVLRVMRGLDQTVGFGQAQRRAGQAQDH
jgi:ATP synthase protein I